MPDDINEEFSRALNKLFEESKGFEAIYKQYYDLFSYHATQRLTTFNFFMVTISFLSNAYATLITKSDGSSKLYWMSASLALAAYVLVILFGRLDRRNEQIVEINEKPINKLQEMLSNKLGGDPIWRTFEETDKKARRLGTFGTLLPLIYWISSILAAAGSTYGMAHAAPELPLCFVLFVFIAMIIASAPAIGVRPPFGAR
ncbi:MAG: hypothetical protein WA840_23950 [Caulobacteraceae bacterium]